MFVYSKEFEKIIGGDPDLVAGDQWARYSSVAAFDNGQFVAAGNFGYHNEDAFSATGLMRPEIVIPDIVPQNQMIIGSAGLDDIHALCPVEGTASSMFAGETLASGGQRAMVVSRSSQDQIPAGDTLISGLAVDAKTSPTNTGVDTSLSDQNGAWDYTNDFSHFVDDPDLASFALNEDYEVVDLQT